MENVAGSRFANQGNPFHAQLADMANPSMHMPHTPWGAEAPLHGL